MKETVTVTPSGGGYDDDGNSIAGGTPIVLTPIEIAPGNTTQSAVTGGDVEAADYTVYLELDAPINDDDDILVRGLTCRARVKTWSSGGLGGLEVLCKSASGISGG